MQKIWLVSHFLDACRLAKDSKAVYDLFMNHTEDCLRNELLYLVPEDEPEPVRFALRSLGECYSIPVLANY